MKILANNCIGYNGQKSKNRDFQKFLDIGVFYMSSISAMGPHVFHWKTKISWRNQPGEHRLPWQKQWLYISSANLPSANAHANAYAHASANGPMEILWNPNEILWNPSGPIGILRNSLDSLWNPLDSVWNPSGIICNTLGSCGILRNQLKVLRSYVSVNY